MGERPKCSLPPGVDTGQNQLPIRDLRCLGRKFPAAFAAAQPAGRNRLGSNQTTLPLSQNKVNRSFPSFAQSPLRFPARWVVGTPLTAAHRRRYTPRPFTSVLPGFFAPQSSCAQADAAYAPLAMCDAARIFAILLSPLLDSLDQPLVRNHARTTEKANHRGDVPRQPSSGRTSARRGRLAR